MKVSQISNAKCSYTQPHNNMSYNVSSKSATSYLVLLAAKGGIEAVKSTKKVNYLADLQRYITKGDFSQLIAGVQALTKTPDAYFDAFHSSLAGFIACFHKEHPNYVPLLRLLALKRINEIPDNTYVNVQIKKDFINSFIENGHEVSAFFAEKFSELNDAIYPTFKAEFVDKCLFSRMYNKQREKKVDYSEAFNACPQKHETLFPFSYMVNCGYSYYYPEKMEEGSIERSINNLYLLSKLDKKLYNGYYIKNSAMIKRDKDIAMQEFIFIDSNIKSHWNRDFLSGYFEPFKKYVESLK